MIGLFGIYVTHICPIDREIQLVDLGISGQHNPYCKLHVYNKGQYPALPQVYRLNPDLKGGPNGHVSPGNVRLPLTITEFCAFTIRKIIGSCPQVRAKKSPATALTSRGNNCSASLYTKSSFI